MAFKATRYVKSLGYAKKPRGRHRISGSIRLLRHSEKAETPKGETPPVSGLTQNGEKMSRAAGKFLGKRGVSYGSSNVTRAEHTAGLIAKGANAKRIISVHPELSWYTYLHDEAAWANEVKVAKGVKEKVIRKWIDGKLPGSIMDNHKIVEERVIKCLDRNYREAKKSGSDILIDVSHSPLVEAVFERLSGKRFDIIRPRTMFRGAESLKIDFLKSGKIILRYRGKHFDITKRFNETVSGNNQLP